MYRITTVLYNKEFQEVLQHVKKLWRAQTYNTLRPVSRRRKVVLLAYFAVLKNHNIMEILSLPTSITKKR